MRIELWTDGSGLAGGGPGGWAYVLRAYDPAGNVLRHREDSGPIAQTTNQRAELLAVSNGLAALTRPTTLTVFSDSEYVVNAFRNGWLDRWCRNGWRNRDGKPVSNRDLWEPLLALVAHQDGVTFQHVKGHARVARCGLPLCGWQGPARVRRCPNCDRPTQRHDVYPLNARADQLAGAQRLAQLEPASTAAA